MIIDYLFIKQYFFFKIFLQKKTTVLEHIIRVNTNKKTDSKKSKLKTKQNTTKTKNNKTKKTKKQRRNSAYMLLQKMYTSS